MEPPSEYLEVLRVFPRMKSPDKPPIERYKIRSEKITPLATVDTLLPYSKEWFLFCFFPYLLGFSEFPKQDRMMKNLCTLPNLLEIHNISEL